MRGAEAALPQRLVASLEIAIGWAVEIAAALLLLAETAILFVGVFSRYVMHSPLVWSDELASILFLWLAMLGAVVALRRGEHMRMTALADMCPPWWKAFFEALAPVAALLFLALIMLPAFNYADDERAITTPALEISNVFRAAALAVGFGLMALLSVLRIVQIGASRQLGLACVAVGAIGLALWLAQPVLRGLGNVNLLIFFVGIAGAAVFAAIPIAFAF